MVGGVKKNIWIIANWKSNKTIREALEWIDFVGPKIEKRSNIKVVVCPSFIDIEEVKKAVLVGNFPLIVGSQDLSPFDVGAFTGEETAQILKQFVDVSILGHSERRQNFGENDEMIEQKVIQAKDHNIIPLVCVQGAETLIPEECSLVAYEPIFAVGTGFADTPESANQVAGQLKQKNPGLEVLYGGSVTPENARSFVERENLSGVLVGKSSLDPEEFFKIVSNCFFV